MRRLAGLLVALVLLLPAAREAWAGCSDGACGRIDWTEVTSFAGSKPTAAKLHGRWAWEASKGWVDNHPLGGKLLGFVWLTCADADSTCQGLLLSEMAKAGTDQKLTFGGQFYDLQMDKPIQPPLLAAEGQQGTPAPLLGANLGTSPMNSTICPTAFALAPQVGPDAGSADASVAPSIDAAMPGGNSDSDSGCRTAPDGRGGGGGALGCLFALLAAAALVRRA